MAWSSANSMLILSCFLRLSNYSECSPFGLGCGSIYSSASSQEIRIRNMARSGLTAETRLFPKSGLGQTQFIRQGTKHFYSSTRQIQEEKKREVSGGYSRKNPYG